MAAVAETVATNTMRNSEKPEAEEIESFEDAFDGSELLRSTHEAAARIRNRDPDLRELRLLSDEEDEVVEQKERDRRRRNRRWPDFRVEFTFRSFLKELNEAIEGNGPHCPNLIRVELPAGVPEWLHRLPRPRYLPNHGTIDEEFLRDIDRPYGLVDLGRTWHAFPNLQVVEVHGSRRTPSSWYVEPALAVLRTLCALPRLRRLALHVRLRLETGFPNGLDEVGEAAAALEGAANRLEELELTRLDVSGNYDLFLARLLAALVSRPGRPRPLRTLDLRISGGWQGTSLAAADTLAELVGASASLRHLRLVNFHLNDAHLEAVCAAVSDHPRSILRTLVWTNNLPFHRTSVVGLRGLRDLLQSNATLTEVRVSGSAESSDPDYRECWRELEAEIEALCRLNRAGRARWWRHLSHGGLPRREWLPLFEAAATHVGVGYGFFRDHAGIIFARPSPPSSVATTQKSGTACLQEDTYGDDDSREASGPNAAGEPSTKRPRMDV